MTKHIFADSYQARDELGRFYTKVHCNSCQSVCINGIPCHETGCPDAWRDKAIPCFECGLDFYPEERYQKVCPDCLADIE